MTRIAGTIDIAAPAETVFDTVADERNEPLYNPRITRVAMVSDEPVGRGSRFVAEPRGAGRSGVMLVEVVDYDRPARLRTAISSPMMSVDGTLTFTPTGAGTRMTWDWDMTLRGVTRVLSPLLRVVGPRWERRNWVGLKRFLEQSR